MKKTLNNAFPVIYYPNLKKREDRKDHMIDELVRKNITATRFDAIDGETLNNVAEDKSRRYTKGAEALVQTVVKIIEKAKAENIPSVCIMEDDISFLDSFDLELPNLEVKPEGWEIIYMSTIHSKPSKELEVTADGVDEMRANANMKIAKWKEWQTKKDEFRTLESSYYKESDEDKKKVIKADQDKVGVVMDGLEQQITEYQDKVNSVYVDVTAKLHESRKKNFTWRIVVENYMMTCWAINANAYDKFLTLAKKGGQVLEDITNAMNKDGKCYSLRTNVAKQIRGYSDIAQEELTNLNTKK